MAHRRQRTDAAQRYGALHFRSLALVHLAQGDGLPADRQRPTPSPKRGAAEPATVRGAPPRKERPRHVARTGTPPSDCRYAPLSFVSDMQPSQHQQRVVARAAPRPAAQRVVPKGVVPVGRPSGPTAPTKPPPAVAAPRATHVARVIVVPTNVAPTISPVSPADAVLPIERATDSAPTLSPQQPQTCAHPNPTVVRPLSARQEVIQQETLPAIQHKRPDALSQDTAAGAPVLPSPLPPSSPIDPPLVAGAAIADPDPWSPSVTPALEHIDIDIRTDASDTPECFKHTPTDRPPRDCRPDESPTHAAPCVESFGDDDDDGNAEKGEKREWWHDESHTEATMVKDEPQVCKRRRIEVDAPPHGGESAEPSDDPAPEPLESPFVSYCNDDRDADRISSGNIDKPAPLDRKAFDRNAIAYTPPCLPTVTALRERRAGHRHTGCTGGAQVSPCGRVVDRPVVREIVLAGPWNIPQRATVDASVDNATRTAIRFWVDRPVASVRVMGVQSTFCLAIDGVSIEPHSIDGTLDMGDVCDTECPPYRVPPGETGEGLRKALAVVTTARIHGHYIASGVLDLAAVSARPGAATTTALVFCEQLDRAALDRLTVRFVTYNVWRESLGPNGAVASGGWLYGGAS